jgi:hypothetical protein
MTKLHENRSQNNAVEPLEGARKSWLLKACLYLLKLTSLAFDAAASCLAAILIKCLSTNRWQYDYVVFKPEEDDENV